MGKMQWAKRAEEIKEQRERKEIIFCFAEIVKHVFHQWWNEVPGNIRVVLLNALCLLELIIYKFSCLSTILRTCCHQLNHWKWKKMSSGHGFFCSWLSFFKALHTKSSPQTRRVLCSKEKRFFNLIIKILNCTQKIHPIYRTQHFKSLNELAKSLQSPRK